MRAGYLAAAAVTVAAMLAGCGGPAASTPGAQAAGSATAGTGTGGGAARGAGTGTASTPTAPGSQAPVPVESNPPGDIPDSVAFVDYRNAAAGYGFRHPEGWARTENGDAVTFTDKLNSVAAEATVPSAPLTVANARAQEVPRLQGTQAAFALVSVDPATLPAGSGVKVVFRRNSAPDPVTGRQVRDQVEEYLVSSSGRAVRLSLSGPVGADNVDAYRTISDSLVLR